jgi:hypothetical protein
MYLSLINRNGMAAEIRNPKTGSGENITEYISNWFSAELMTSYIIKKNAWEIWSGAAFTHQSALTRDNIFNSGDFSGGRLVFAIPLRFHWRLAKS